MQDMDSTLGISPNLASSAADPVVAEFGRVRLRWHARSLRGNRTIAEAARLVGLNRDELSRIERGETKQIQFQTVAKLLAGYQCALGDLFEVEAATQPKTSVPLYIHAVAALANGTIPIKSVGRRAVRRPAELDVTTAGDEAAFSPSPSNTPTRRRRSPVGTHNR